MLCNIRWPNRFSSLWRKKRHHLAIIVTYEEFVARICAGYSSRCIRPEQQTFLFFFSFFFFSVFFCRESIFCRDLSCWGGRWDLLGVYNGINTGQPFWYDGNSVRSTAVPQQQTTPSFPLHRKPLNYQEHSRWGPLHTSPVNRHLVLYFLCKSSDVLIRHRNIYKGNSRDGEISVVVVKIGRKHRAQTDDSLDEPKWNLGKLNSRRLLASGLLYDASWGPGPAVHAHGLLAASHMVCLRPMPRLCLLSAAPPSHSLSGKSSSIV